MVKAELFVGGKTIIGRNLHILVDTLGMLLMVVVHGPDVQDYEGRATVLESIRDLDRRLKTVFADGAYGKADLPSHIQNEERIQLQTVLRPAHAKGFQVLPKLWIVEPTFAWITRRRRLCKDYERQADSSETMVFIAMIDLMSRRLASHSRTQFPNKLYRLQRAYDNGFGACVAEDDAETAEYAYSCATLKAPEIDRTLAGTNRFQSFRNRPLMDS